MNKKVIATILMCMILELCLVSARPLTDYSFVTSTSHSTPDEFPVWDGAFPASNTYDNNLSSYGVAPAGNTGAIEFSVSAPSNYLIPLPGLDVNRTSLINFRACTGGGAVTDYESSIPADCLIKNFSNGEFSRVNTLDVRIISRSIGGDCVGVYCKNTSNDVWVEAGSTTCGTGCANRLYDAGDIQWNFGTRRGTAAERVAQAGTGFAVISMGGIVIGIIGLAVKGASAIVGAMLGIVGILVIVIGAAVFLIMIDPEEYDDPDE